MSKDDEYMLTINRLEGERDSWRKRSREKTAEIEKLREQLVRAERQVLTSGTVAGRCANEQQGPCLEFKAADGQLSEWNESDRLRARVVKLESVLTAVAGVLQERLPAGAKRVWLLEVAAGVSAMASEIERLIAECVVLRTQLLFVASESKKHNAEIERLKAELQKIRTTSLFQVQSINRILGVAVEEEE